MYPEILTVEISNAKIMLFVKQEKLFQCRMKNKNPFQLMFFKKKLLTKSNCKKAWNWLEGEKNIFQASHNDKLS